jgi:predicted membrane protein
MTNLKERMIKMNKKYVTGLIIIIVGALLLLGQVSDFNLWSLFANWWPLIFVVMGASMLVTSKGNNLGGLILVLIFGAILLNVNDILPGNYWRYTWPLIIVAIGVWFIFGRNPVHGKNHDNNDDYISSFAMFSGTETRVISKNFQGANLSAMFGGVELDLRSAQTSLPEIKVDAFAAFGGIDIKVPENWKVVITGLPLFGGWDNKTRVTDDPNATILRIKCFVAFGGMDVNN